MVHRRHSKSTLIIFQGNFSAHCFIAFPLVRDILRLEEIAHGQEAKTYILADLHNALGMLTVHQQVPSRSPMICLSRSLSLSPSLSLALPSSLYLSIFLFFSLSLFRPPPPLCTLALVMQKCLAQGFMATPEEFQTSNRRISFHFSKSAPPEPEPRICRLSILNLERCTLHPTPYTLHPTPCALRLIS